MQTDALKMKWRNGDTTLGAWIAMREPLLIEQIASSGYDYVCIDMQHGLSGIGDVVAGLQAMATGTATPLVRVPWNEPGIIGRVLDLGALGVIIPMVNTRAEAEAAVAACRYAPHGGRSMGPIAAGARYGSTYFGVANDHVACIPMIETRQAIQNLDEILAVPGIDAVYVGPADLSISYGLPPGTDQEDASWNDAIRAVVDKCRMRGITPGIHSNAAVSPKRHQQGFRMITVTSDMLAAMGGLRSDLAAVRNAVGSGGSAGSGGSTPTYPTDTRSTTRPDDGRGGLPAGPADRGPYG
jgi:4-hydroxy-2-oxoheptanedioate aldolase